ncbi:MAG: GPR endopeptidase, partial [Clostridia bacterium]|nr:GPR endopeptidase [Clostridia bacterium]
KRYFIGIMAKALKEIISSASEKPFPSVLVIGLGNGLMTADALGKKVVEKIIATRQIPESQNLTTVSAFAAGVAGVTGIDSFEVVKGLKEEVKPDMIICVDALSAFSTDRIGRAFQISDAGIRAGGGSGKPSKYKLCRDTLGVPVLAVGVPFVVSAKKLLFEASGGKEFSNKIIPEEDMFVTPRDVDAILWDCSEIIGAALNCALHPDLGLSGALSLTS